MEYAIGDKVSLIIGRPTNLGVNVYIGDDQIDGLLYHNEIFQSLELGQVVDGYIKNIREDGKIDVSLQPQGFQNVIDQNLSIILTQLKARQGYLKLTDKSEPELIKEKLNMSKKAFKSAVGQLYKLKKITIEEDGIYLVK
ncbi:MAG: DNA-binding protein [Chitinophagales bacterium]|nr:DNA-binding protein [Chitinophagales bacterium]